nr:NAD(P)H-hydrate epimerase [Acinetobacter lwoffii]
MQQQVYHSRDLQAWEQRWFQQQNSSYGLMQQVAWGISQRLITLFSQQKIKKIAVCCGQGNNAGDGYLVAKYLKQAGFSVGWCFKKYAETKQVEF